MVNIKRYGKRIASYGLTILLCPVFLLSHPVLNRCPALSLALLNNPFARQIYHRITLIYHGIRSLVGRRCLYIDISHIAQADHETGIQRVVKETIRALYASSRGGVNVVAVELKDGDLFEARDWCRAKGMPPPSKQFASPFRIEFVRGDVLLMLDSSWMRYTEFYPVFDRARLANVPVITTVYDLLPITLPPGNFGDGAHEWFEGWFRNAVQSSDGLLCISRAVANEVIAYVEKNCPEKMALKVGYWHLGSDLKVNDFESGCSDRVKAVQRKPYLLTVGTIEPRKSHALLLDAMEMLWARGIELSLCVAGKQGWMVDELMERMRAHPELGNRLFLVEKPSDGEISALYQGATGLIFLSIGEGFGLPLVEAAHYGTPILCSDIPVFREIAGEFATYLKLGTSQSVSDGIQSWWNLRKSGTLPDTHNMPRLTWEESAEQMLKVVVDGNWLWGRR